MSSRSEAWREVSGLISRLKDVAEAVASNAVRLRNNKSSFVTFRANDDGSIDVTPSIKWTNLSAAQAERIIRSLSGVSAETGPQADQTPSEGPESKTNGA